MPNARLHLELFILQRINKPLLSFSSCHIRCLWANLMSLFKFTESTSKVYFPVPISSHVAELIWDLFQVLSKDIKLWEGYGRRVSPTLYILIKWQNRIHMVDMVMARADVDRSAKVQSHSASNRFMVIRETSTGKWDLTSSSVLLATKKLLLSLQRIWQQMSWCYVSDVDSEGWWVLWSPLGPWPAAFYLILRERMDLEGRAQRHWDTLGCKVHLTRARGMLNLHRGTLAKFHGVVWRASLILLDER